MKTDKQELTKNKDKSFILLVTFTKAEIDKTYQKVLQSIQANFENNGFRKGKAPIEIIKANVSETKIIEEVLTTLSSETYSQKIKQHDLHPVIQPQVKILNPPVTFGKDWDIEITGCELPATDLNIKYKDEIKLINKSTDNDNQKLNKTIDSLIKNSTVVIPDILIKADMESKLSQLVDQTTQAGINVNQYLKSKNTTLEQYQENLKIQIKNEWVTNLAIDYIARDQKIDITEIEVKDIISKNKNLEQNPNLVYYLLTQQKVFDYLKKI